MSDHEERLRSLEIEMAVIKSSLISIEAYTKKNSIQIEQINTQSAQSKQTLDKWGGGVTLVTKLVLLLCTVIGMTIGVAEYARGQQIVFSLEKGQEDYEEFKADYTAAIVSVCKNIYKKIDACAEATKERYEKKDNDYYRVYFEYVLGER